MLELSDEGIVSLPKIVEKMAHNPATLYKIKERGFLRPGYYADLVLVKPDAPHTVSTDTIVSKCGWSPFEGHIFRWDITHTWINGRAVYQEGEFNEQQMGQRLTFDR